MSRTARARMIQAAQMPHGFGFQPQPLQQHLQGEAGGEAGGSGEGDNANSGSGEGGDGTNDGTNDGANDGDDGSKKGGDKEDSKNPEGIDAAKYAELLKHSRKHEDENKRLRAAAKELADLKKKDMTDTQKAEAEKVEAIERADKLAIDLARERVGRVHKLEDTDLDDIDKILKGIPAAEYEERAMTLGKRFADARPKPGKSGGEHKGDPKPKKPTSLAAAVEGFYAR